MSGWGLAAWLTYLDKRADGLTIGGLLGNIAIGTVCGPIAIIGFIFLTICEMDFWNKKL